MPAVGWDAHGSLSSAESRRAPCYTCSQRKETIWEGAADDAIASGARLRSADWPGPDRNEYSHTNCAQNLMWERVVTATTLEQIKHAAEVGSSQLYH